MFMKMMKRALALLLCIVMVVGLVPATVFAAADSNTDPIVGTKYVLAGSDFQADSGDTAGKANINAIISEIKGAGYTTMDGFLFAGDYSVGATKTSNVTALKSTIQTAYPELTDNDLVLIQGNHDNSASYGGTEAGLVGSVLNESGANDAKDYGVFVINEQDYNWKGKNETLVKNTAANLKGYLDAKRNAGYTKPIFVVSHLPLNYNMRTKNDGDGMYANYIFDVLNEAGAAGLNIFFLFGHDHSNGWDDYLGGSAIYLEKGDTIKIAQGSQTSWKEETLAFTYMNAGYVGYYRNVNTGSETDLTMTLFEITNDEVKVRRFSQSGEHDLKSEGVTNSYKNESGYSPDTTVYTSPQTVKLNKTITPTGEEITPPDGGNTGSGTTERTYTRVTSTSGLVSGGKYLIIHNGQNDFMIPVVTSNDTRIGYDLVTGPSGLGNDAITGEYQDYEWTFTSVDGGWNIGADAGYMYFEAARKRHAAQLGAMAHVMEIGGSANNFTFTNKTYNGGTYVLNYNSTGDLINGYASDAAPFYIYRLTNEGSESPNVDTIGGSWVTITEADTKHVYQLDTDGIDTGVEYLIVAEGYPYAMSTAGPSNNKVDITLSVDEKTAYADSDTYGWTFTADGDTYRIRLNGSTYLGYYKELVSAKTWPNKSKQQNQYRWTINSNSDGRYHIIRGGQYLRWSNSGGYFEAEDQTYVRLYKYVKMETSTALYGKIEGELTYNVAIGTTAAEALAAVKAGIDILYHTGDANVAQTFPDDGEGMTWTLDPSYDGVTPGEYAVTIAYNGVTLGVAKVVVPRLNITGYTVEPAEGTVNKGASQAARTGAYIIVTLENGNFYKVPVTVAMLTKADGSAVSTGEEGVIEHLTLTYNGVKITENFTLNVVAGTGNNYPEYPDEGAVKVNKTATGIDFQSSGIAQIELSASGVPVKKGADVIVMLDTSSSMESNKVTVDGQQITRLEVLTKALNNMLKQFKTKGDDGELLDIRVAIADFNGYYSDSSSKYYLDSEDHLINGSIRTNDPLARVLTGSGNNKLDESAFVAASTIPDNYFTTRNAQVNADTPQNELAYKSGTNYDYAFDAVYQLGEAITRANTDSGEERDLFVVFMSDGAPYQFNYFSAQSGSDRGTTEASYWNNWLQGTMENHMFDANARNDYYNADGKHWMAEAIKGDPGTTYPVIRKNNAADIDGDNWVNVNGLGATMFSIGFCLKVDKEITVQTMDSVIRNIATGEQYYYRADTAETLNTAFTQIGSEIAYAANNARFVDQMGNNFNLQMKPVTYSVVNGTTTINKTLTPTIEILSYDIYTRQDYLSGKCAIDQIGNRKGSVTVLETVRFSADGTKAYSDQIDSDNDGIKGWTVAADGTIVFDDGDNILADGTKEGFVKGIIYAKTFIYNTNILAVEVDGVSIPAGENNNGTTTKVTTNVLPSETFYWKMGTIQTSELAMRYYVYLDGSMEGTKPAGSYATNEFAVLYYDNYLGNSCFKGTVSPSVAWKSANVSYAFYLVNEKGEIVVNQATGKTGSFANKVAVTNPVVYEEILLNNTDRISILDVKAADDDVLPKYYTLYDSNAVYAVTINSNATGMWTIEQSADKVASTYVTQYKTSDASAYSNASTNGTVGDDYTHTVVWFAVVWSISAHPDSVVVDYGLPVDISVLSNDMFGSAGNLAGIGAVESLPEGYDNGNMHTSALNTGFSADFNGKYGNAHADVKNGLVRYTLNSTAMNSYEKFAYAVQYTGSENAGYYYDTVTVIPATTIYYEDNFVNLESYTWSSGWQKVDKENEKWVWSQEGTVVDATQSEDRPGIYSLTDANNIYGYDSVNKSMGTYSMGAAMKAGVDYDNYGLASFTFYGTGFDIISMTNNTTGTIYVDVYQGDNLVEGKSFIVDTYYGYHQVSGDANGDGTIEDGELVWAVNPDATDSIYQVPVMKVDGLPYGKYTAKITVFYSPVYDNVDGSTGYDFYLDAIRIYDPANDGAADTDNVIENAYKADGEGWPSYIELRNMLIDPNGDGNTDDGAFGNADTSTKVEGVVFIDGDASVGEAQLTDYINYGPNNEVYLAPGQRVAFMLNTPDNVDRIHIGLKSADGAKVTYTITNIAQSSGVTAGQWYNARTYTLDTTTDMYYDMTDWKKDIIVISNTGDRYDTNGILSITNIKSTYISNPNGTNTPNEVNTVDLANETTVYMTASAAMLTLRAVNTMDLPETLEPEQSEVSGDRNHDQKDEKTWFATFDAEEIGERITEQAENLCATVKRSKRMKADGTYDEPKMGEYLVRIDPVVESVTVEAKKNPEQIAKDVLKGLPGGFFG